VRVLRETVALLSAAVLVSMFCVFCYVVSPWWRAWECYAAGSTVTVRSSGQKGLVVGDPWYRSVPVKFADGTVHYHEPEELK